MTAKMSEAGPNEPVLHVETTTRPLVLVLCQLRQHFVDAVDEFDDDGGVQALQPLTNSGTGTLAETRRWWKSAAAKAS